MHKREWVCKGRWHGASGLLLLGSDIPGHGMFQGSSGFLHGSYWVSALATGCSALPHSGLQASEGPPLHLFPNSQRPFPLVLMGRQLPPLAVCWF